MRDGIDDESYGQIFKPVSIFIFKIKMEFCEIILQVLTFVVLYIDYLKGDGDVSA